jgi:hypothetical protein
MGGRHGRARRWQWWGRGSGRAGGLQREGEYCGEYAKSANALMRDAGALRELSNPSRADKREFFEQSLHLSQIVECEAPCATTLYADLFFSHLCFRLSDRNPQLVFGAFEDEPNPAVAGRDLLLLEWNRVVVLLANIKVLANRRDDVLFRTSLMCLFV